VETIELETTRKVIDRTVVSVMETLLGLTVEPCGTPWHKMPDRVTAAIQFNGSTVGSLVVEMDGTLACKFSGGLLGIDTPESVDNDVRDGLGEIANVIAGNMNTDFGWGAILSYPYIVDGSDFKIRVCGNCRTLRQSYAYGSDVFWVSWIVRCTEPEHTDCGCD
jgi:CheY-specific phosphatase CheX